VCIYSLDNNKIIFFSYKCNGWRVFLYNFHYEFAFYYRDMLMILSWMFNMESIRWFQKNKSKKI
jgi:hypothetical protein